MVYAFECWVGPGHGGGKEYLKLPRRDPMRQAMADRSFVRIKNRHGILRGYGLIQNLQLDFIVKNCSGSMTMNQVNSLPVERSGEQLPQHPAIRIAGGDVHGVAAEREAIHGDGHWRCVAHFHDLRRLQ